MSHDLMIGGFVIADSPQPTPASVKIRRRLPNSSIATRTALRAIEAFQRVLDDEADSEAELGIVEIERFVDSDKAKSFLIQELKPLIEQALNQTHDFTALVTQVKSNILAIFESRYPGSNIEEVADQLPEEGAIYFAVEMLLGKLDATSYLREPNKLHGVPTEFSLYKYLDKYVRIYKSYSKQRDLDFQLIGPSKALINYFAPPVGAMLHAVLDNVVKYAPAGSKVNVKVTDEAKHVNIVFSSLGPEVKKHETEMIFLVGYRSEAAQILESGGMGFGLGAARFISDAMSIGLSFTQKTQEDDHWPGHFPTQFRLRFHRSGTDKSQNSN